MKKLPPSRNVQADARLVASLQAKFGTGNVKVVEKSIEKRAERFKIKLCVINK